VGSNPILSAKALNERFFYIRQRGKLAFQRWRYKKAIRDSGAFGQSSSSTGITAGTPARFVALAL
jgi:hypothetical protein